MVHGAVGRWLGWKGVYDIPRQGTATNVRCPKSRKLPLEMTMAATKRVLLNKDGQCIRRYSYGGAVINEVARTQTALFGVHAAHIARLPERTKLPTETLPK